MALSLIDDDRLLHLGCGRVTGVSGLIGVNDEASDAGNGERAAADAACAGAARVDGKDDRIPGGATGGDQRNRQARSVRDRRRGLGKRDGLCDQRSTVPVPDN